MLEGTVSSVPPKGEGNTLIRFHPADTSNILFICGGAFGGIENIIARRINKSVIGFGGDIIGTKQKASWDILRKYSLRSHGVRIYPEFIGRLPVIVPLEGLDEDALVHIIREPKNSLLKQYKELFSYEGVN